MATHSSVLAWRVPGTGEPGGLQSMGSHRVGHDWSDLTAAAAVLLISDFSSVSSVSFQFSKYLCNQHFILSVELLVFYKTLIEPLGVVIVFLLAKLLQLCQTLRNSVVWTAACQATLSMRFSRQEYWSGLPCPPPRDLPDAGMEPASPALQADSLLLSHQGSHCFPE